MKFVLSLLLLTFAPIYIFANELEFRHYEEGKLQWDDFTSVQDSTMDSTSLFKPYISFKKEDIERNDSNFTVIKSYNFIFKNKVYAPTEKRTNEQLRYYQIIFDIKEYYRREIQDSINIRTLFEGMQSQYLRINAISDSVITTFELEYQNNKNTSVLEKWENIYNTKLVKTELLLLPHVTIPNFGVSLDIGGRYGIYTGEIKEIIKPNYGYYFGFTVFTKDLFFYLRLGTVGGKVKKVFIYEDDWPEGMGLNLTEFDLSVGYPLFNNSTHKLTPFIGWGVHEITDKGDNEFYENLSTTSHSFVAGLNYDLILHESTNLAPSFLFSGNKSNKQDILNIRLSLTNVNHSFFKGNSIMLSVGYSIFGRLVSIE